MFGANIGEALLAWHVVFPPHPLHWQVQLELPPADGNRGLLSWVPLQQNIPVYWVASSGYCFDAVQHEAFIDEIVGK